MELVNEFRVPVPIDQAWEVLTNVARIAPCIPGAQLLSVDGDDFTGAVKVKVGPISVSYQGEATFKEKERIGAPRDHQGQRQGNPRQGNAAAVITCELKDEGDATTCVLTTDLTIWQGRAVRPRCAGRRVGQADRAVRPAAGGRSSGRRHRRAVIRDRPGPVPAPAAFSAPRADDAAAADLNVLSLIALRWPSARCRSPAGCWWVSCSAGCWARAVADHAAPTSWCCLRRGRRRTDGRRTVIDMTKPVVQKPHCKL